MQIRPIILTAGLNLDMSDTTVQDGAVVSVYNAYVDRGGAVRTVPGCVEYLDLGVTGGTWAWYCIPHELMLIVSAGRIWKQVERGGSITEITGATLTADVQPSFAADADTMFICAGSKIYRINPAGTVAISLGAASPDNVTDIVFIGGYLLANGDAAGGAVPGDTHYSDDKAGNYAAWEVYNNETHPDGLQSLVVAYEQVYNIGRTSLEVTYIDGTVPFSVNKNAAQHFGTPAAQSVAFDQENIYYISEVAGSRKIIQLKGGGAPQIISFPIDIPIENFERVDDAQGFMMAFGGQNGYVITFPSANATVDDQYWESITLFYHLQRKQWLFLSKWDKDSGIYGPYRGVSFCYVEPWGGLRLIGGRDGKLYQISTIQNTDYAVETVFEHRYRDNGAKEWKLPRRISLGAPGQYRRPAPQTQGGTFEKRQHEFIYSDLTDAGDVLRASIKTGQIRHGSPLKKVSRKYRYDVECGKGEFVANGVTEEFDLLRN